MLDLPVRLPVVDNPLTCVRQLIFETDWEDFPYGMHGSGFLAEWSEMLFLVTSALHTARARELAACANSGR